MVRIHPRQVLTLLFALNALLVTGFLLTHNADVGSPALVRFFRLGAEASIPPWYNGSMLLVAGLVAGLRALDLRQNHAGAHWKIYAVAAFGFVFLSADEVAQIHETISGTMHRRMSGRAGAWAADAGAWDLVTAGLYITAGLVVAALLWRDAVALLRERAGRTAMFVGGGVFVLGAVVVDHLTFPLGYGLNMALEDGLEITGAAVSIYAMLLKLGTVTVRVSVTGAAPEAVTERLMVRARSRARTEPGPADEDLSEYTGVAH